MTILRAILNAPNKYLDRIAKRVGVQNAIGIAMILISAYSVYNPLGPLEGYFYTHNPHLHYLFYTYIFGVCGMVLLLVEVNIDVLRIFTLPLYLHVAIVFFLFSNGVLLIIYGLLLYLIYYYVYQLRQEQERDKINSSSSV